MTANQLSAVAGIVLSLLFSYIPFLQSWYAPKDSATKSLIMLGALALVALGVFGLSCSGWWVYVSCDQSGTKALIEAFVVAAIANQTTYRLSPETKFARVAKVMRDAKEARELGVG